MIEQVPETFTSHQFILALAHQYQNLYVDALASYRTTSRRDSPFLVVHGVLSRHLLTMSDRVHYNGKVKSEDICGHSNECAQWQKVGATCTS